MFFLCGTFILYVLYEPFIEVPLFQETSWLHAWTRDMKNFIKVLKKLTIKDNSNFKMVLQIAISERWTNQTEKTTFENSRTLKNKYEEIHLLSWQKSEL